MDRKKLTAFVLVLMMLFPTALGGSKLSAFKSADDKLTLKPGEKLIYSVRWMKLPVGKAVLQVRDITEINGEPVYHLTTYTKANRIIRLIYRVEDRISSYVTVDGFRPLRFKKRLREGKRKKDERIEFDWEKKEATYYKTKHRKEIKRRTIPFPEGIQDSLSCLYFLRSLPLEMGKEYTMQVATERKCWNLVIKPIKKTKINLRRLGTFNALLIEPIVEFEGLFVHDRKLQIWLDEETKIPLMMVADIPIGSISVVLIEIADTKAAIKKIAPPKTGKPPWEPTESGKRGDR